MLNKISEAIGCQEYEIALKLIEEYLKNGNPYTDDIAVLEASVYMETNNFSTAYSCICDGLKFNPLNYELYFMLGNFYEIQGAMKKAYLCYENTLYHCKENKEDFSFLSSYFETFKVTNNTIVPKVSIIILTLNQLAYTIKCIDSIRRYCSPSCYEIIVVDNGSTDETKQYLMSQDDIKYQFNEKNLGFSGGCNVGIHMAQDENDIFLLNNDTVMTENALFSLRMGLYENDKIGAAGSVSNYAAFQTISKTFDTFEEYLDYAFFNNVPTKNALEHRIFLVGFAFLLKRSVYNVIGDLDERFFPGNFEDNDYCTRLILNDYQLVLCNNSFIFHFGSSTFACLEEKIKNSYDSILIDNLQRYIEKWHFNPGLSCICCDEIIQLMDKQDNLQPINVLEIGCACGATLIEIKNRFPNATLYGIESDEHTAGFSTHVANVIQGNVEVLDNPFSVVYDYIIIGDISKEILYPEKLLTKIKNWLSPNGYILVGVPNILHYSVILPILQGNFTYSDDGVLNPMHLRFFTLFNSVKLLQNSGYKIVDYIKDSTPESILDDETIKFIEQLTQLPNVVKKEQILTIKYIFKAGTNTK